MDILIGLLAVVVLGFFPMLIYSTILWWFDRYEKEPLGLLVIAFLWGAVPAIIFSVIAQLVFDIPIVQLAGPGLGADFMNASFIAPLTEEPFKALLLLLLILAFHREIDSPLDGILYGGLIGCGFAATENVLYFLGAFSTSGLLGVLGLAFLRALLFGLNHALFTACTGLGLALARTTPHTTVKIVAPAAGLAAGMALHAIHNAGTVLAPALGWPILISIVADWGGVLAMIGTIVWISLRERQWIVDQLAEEVDIGTLGKREYEVIQSYPKRVAERLRALLAFDFSRWWALETYYRLATKLAFTKQSWEAHGKEQATFLRIEAMRKELYQLRSRRSE
ncbi:MAG: PrsW family intramembrane metalloprotease [Anaerolineae bacterium]|nr:PrsW family intramembrane metalloprotease [Anaerolineae bacterium]